MSSIQTHPDVKRRNAQRSARNARTKRAARQFCITYLAKTM